MTTAENIVNDDANIVAGELPETVALDDMISFPLTLQLKDISGKPPILSAFAENALMSIFDHRSNDGDFWHYRLLPHIDPVLYVAGAVDMNRYAATLIHLFELDQDAVTSLAKQAIEATPKEDMTQSIAMFHLVSSTYRVLHDTHPDAMNEGTFKTAIDMMDVMIEESHPALGIDDIANLIASDTNSTVATWSMMIAYNAPSTKEDGEGGIEVTGLTYANAYVHQSDVLRVLVSTKQVEQTAEAVTKSLFYGTPVNAAQCIATFTDKAFIEGIVDKEERDKVRLELVKWLAFQEGYELVKVEKVNIDDDLMTEVELPTVQYDPDLEVGDFFVEFAKDKPCALTEFEHSILVPICSRLMIDNEKRRLFGTIAEPYRSGVSQEIRDKVYAGDEPDHDLDEVACLISTLFEDENSHVAYGEYRAADATYAIANPFNYSED